MPLANGLSYFLALQEAGVETEGLFLNGSVHGFSLATPEIALAGNDDLVDDHLAHWFELAMEWLKRVTNK